MKRSRLRKWYLKNRSEFSKIAYAKQQNSQVALLRKRQTRYYADLNEKDVVDNK